MNLEIGDLMYDAKDKELGMIIEKVLISAPAFEGKKHLYDYTIEWSAAHNKYFHSVCCNTDMLSEWRESYLELYATIHR